MVVSRSQISPVGICCRGANVFPEQIRQYFKDESFYAADVNSRGLCGELVNETKLFASEAFSPASATVKVRTTLPARRSTHPLTYSFSPSIVCLRIDMQSSAGLWALTSFTHIRCKCAKNFVETQVSKLRVIL